MWEWLSSHDYRLALQNLSRLESRSHDKTLRVTRNAHPAPRNPQPVTQIRIIRSFQSEIRIPKSKIELKPFHLPGKIVFQGTFAINIRGGAVKSASERGYLE